MQCKVNLLVLKSTAVKFKYLYLLYFSKSVFERPWPKQKVPNSTLALVSLIDAVEKWRGNDATHIPQDKVSANIWKLVHLCVSLQVPISMPTTIFNTI
jgi:hypothetical protein